MDQPHQPTQLTTLAPHLWEALVVLTLFALPWQTRWIFHEALIQGQVWEYGRFSLYAVDLLVLASAITWAITQAVQPRLRRLSALPLLCMGGLLFVSFMSIYFALDAGLAFNGFIRLAEGMVLFLLITQLRWSWRVPVWSVVVAGVVQSVMAFFEFLFQYIPSFKWLGLAAQDPTTSGVSVVVTTTGRFLRAYGTFPHPNILGGFMVYAIILAVALAITTEHERKRTVLYALLPLLTVGLLFSFSRQSLLGVVVSLMAFPSMMAIRAKEQMRVWTIATGAVFVSALALSAVFAPLMLARLQVAGPLEAHSLDARAVGLKEAELILWDVWPQGVGIGNYTWALHEKIDSSFAAKDLQPVHIVPALIMAEIGIFGLLFYALFLAMLFWEGRHHPEPERRSTHLAIAGALIIIPIFLGLWDHYLWSLPVGQWMFWSMCGIAVLVTHKHEGWQRV